MNNNLYQWHDEQMAKNEIGEVNRAVEQTRLVREAGLLGPSLLARVAKALSNLLKARGEKITETGSHEGESYQSIKER